jgi:hypothetical protein
MIANCGYGHTACARDRERGEDLRYQSCARGAAPATRQHWSRRPTVRECSADGKLDDIDTIVRTARLGNACNGNLVIRAQQCVGRV